MQLKLHWHLSKINVMQIIRNHMIRLPIWTNHCPQPRYQTLTKHKKCEPYLYFLRCIKTECHNFGPCFNIKTIFWGIWVTIWDCKNTKRHTTHTIVSWPNPEQWVIVHTSYLKMIITQSIYIYILSIITRKWVNWKHTAPRVV